MRLGLRPRVNDTIRRRWGGSLLSGPGGPAKVSEYVH